MNDQWIEISKTLEKIIDYRGKTPKKLGGDWAGKGYRALSALQVKTSGLDNLDSVKYLGKDLYKKWMKDEIKKGDILLTSEAPAGQVMVWDSDEKIVLSQRLFGLRAKKNYNSYFIKYFLQSTTGQSEITRNTSGSTVFGISAKMFDLIKIPDFEKGRQDNIASVLKSLDDKIELNNIINAELEQMAKTLYDYWFVQFDFPDENGRPYKSSSGEMVYSEELKREIPKGWSSGDIEQLGSVVGGSTPSTKDPNNFTNDGIPWITPDDLSERKNCKFISKGNRDITKEGMVDALLKKYPKGTVLLSSRAPIGYMAIARNELTTNQGFKSIVPNRGFSTEFVYYATKNYVHPIIQYSSGSTFKEISGTVLKMLTFSIPPKNVADKYSALVESIFRQQDVLEQENQSLAELRDWLLPMLMNGQVRVSN